MDEIIEEIIVSDNNDVLNRQPFVDQVINIIERISSQNGSKCFAINGKWGVGKTFILTNQLEKQLEELPDENANNKYIVFHYNCWQYDYYEEPLVAIVSSMLDTINEKEEIIPKDIKAKIKGLLKTIGSALLLTVNDSVKAATKIDLERIVKFALDTKQAAEQEITDTSKFDSNFIFKKTLKKLQETLTILAQRKTIIIVVDELDRCLPEYTIKVLERLHHVFEGVPNTQVVLSIDKSQLENIVEQTFGKNTQTDQYLSKFINFYINLDEGQMNQELFDIKFSYYVEQFEYSNIATKKEDIEEFKACIFNGMGMRERIQTIEKCNLIHSLLNTENAKKDYVFMCLELAFAVLKYWKIDYNENRTVYQDNVFNLNCKDENINGVHFLNNRYRKVQRKYIFHEDGGRILHCTDIWGAILVCYEMLLNNDEKYISSDYYLNDNIIEYIEEYIKLLNTIN